MSYTNQNAADGLIMNHVAAVSHNPSQPSTGWTQLRCASLPHCSRRPAENPRRASLTSDGFWQVEVRSARGFGHIVQ